MTLLALSAAPGCSDDDPDADASSGDCGLELDMRGAVSGAFVLDPVVGCASGSTSSTLLLIYIGTVGGADHTAVLSFDLAPGQSETTGSLRVERDSDEVAWRTETDCAIVITENEVTATLDDGSDRRLAGTATCGALVSEGHDPITLDGPIAFRTLAFVPHGPGS